MEDLLEDLEDLVVVEVAAHGNRLLTNSMTIIIYVICQYLNTYVIHVENALRS